MIEKLFKVENEDLIQYTIPNSDICIWPLIRYKIFFDYISKRLDILFPHSIIEKNKFLDKLKYIKELTFNPLFFVNKNFEIVIISSSRTNQLKEGKYFNFLYDYYNLIYPNNTIFLEKSFRKKFYKPKYFKNTYLFDSIKLIPYMKSKVHILKKENIVIEEFVNMLRRSNLFDNLYLEKLKAYIVSIFKKTQFYKEAYTRLLKKLNPKILFYNTASYGGPNAIIIKIAKEMGIKVGEFQHGVITKAHLAYNYGDAIFKSEEYKKYLPDYLLTYGNFWNKNMKIPVKKITIGNPHFWYNYNKLKDKNIQANKNKKIILIVSQGTVTNINVNLAKKLSKMIDDNYKVIFRLHPGEVGFEERYNDLYEYRNVEISRTGDIYELIDKSDYIISVYSTTIYEAASFGKPVFIYKHPLSKLYIPEDLGMWFNSPDELWDLIRKDIKPKNNYDINYFWNKNWKENYINFIENEIGL